ncbi:translation initiation factor IF-2 [Pelobacter propionicus]|uniref:Translation initiation factor IF-2 n=1 Tax=Pelobacter propionicus (strain DSM 2379 / NBRC 103807 / OttBd1) TaxID=338966 RepID=IF2_PELPD|nr:translation initiation factor IF-2 [Pelobacter propionicus]A1AMM1.1 RecName: Full=Translation initiation factor IF-2 [Pelobacter propionicus DSM 2379]ABK98591.1 bacterial translation initiation factor 2 (bIF-2) [Pelobacter propionicus DSM 2379]
MSKIRVSNLAEKLGLEHKEVLARLKEIGVDAKTATSLVDEDVLKKLMPSLSPDGAEEVRVTTTIIRRRAKAAPVVEPAPAAVAESLEEKPAEPVAPAAPTPPEVPAAAPAPPKAAAAPAEAATMNARIIAPPPAPVETAAPVAAAPVAAATAPPEKALPTPPVVEAPVVEAKPEPVVEKPKVPAQPDKPSANQARILGRMEIPGVTTRPTRVVRRDGTVAPAAEHAQRRPSPAAGAPSRGAAPDRSRMKPATLPPSAPPAADDRRKFGGKSAAPHSEGAGKGGKKGGASTAKKKEQPKKHEILEKRERVFDPVYRGSRKKVKERASETRKTEITIPKAIKRIIKISETISVGELAKRMGIKANDLIKSLMKMGMMVTINHALDFETTVILASEYGYEVENMAVDLDEILESTPDAPETLVKRPPVVTIMGHVDHGKTSLLDAIREANVIAGEAGGITQHIGAYDVELNGRKITFLDTPGHEAFTAMRARGAKVTDIVILVVAADDGVMPQTREAINHSKAAGVPIVVAINKIDKPEAKPERVKQELMEFGLVASEWGGDATMVEVSAKKRLNLEGLLEMVLLQADLMELKANPDKEAKGTIVEAKLDRGRGPVATVLVQEGTLKNGDYCVVGVHSGRVRAIHNDRGEKVNEAGPSMPVEVIGLSGVPDAGDVFVSLKDEKQAKEIATLRQIKQREIEMAKHSKVTLEDLYKQIQSGDVKDLNVIVKGDVQGSVEVVSDSFRKLSTDAVRLNVIHSGVGAITETDVNLAAASNTIIIGFNVRPEVKAQAMAEKEGVDIRLYSIIYDAVEDVKKAMEGLLDPTLKEKYLGRAEIREVFSVPKIGNIAGSYVQDGKMLRNAQARLLRDNVVIYEGKLSSLRRIKDDVKEVAAGYECGIGLENYNNIRIGDIIEAFEIEKVATKL